MSVLQSVGGNVGRITLDRPGRMNAIDVALATSLARAITELGRNPGVNVIVINGAGGNLCAGGDFDEVQRLRAEGRAALTALFEAFRGACDAIVAAEVPVIIAVEGVAAAGGFELLQAADIVLVSDDARIADNHVRFGMIPGGGSTARLPRIVGRQQALGLLLSGDLLSGSEAVRLGLAYRSYPRDEFHCRVEQFAADLAARSRDAVTTIKRLVNAHWMRPLPDALDAEIAAVVEHLSGSGFDSGVAAFRAGRQESRA